MEIRQYLFFIRKWTWLLVLGFLIGGSAGYLLAVRQPLVYQSKTKFMVMRSPEERTSDYFSYFEYQSLPRTYSQLINTEPVIEALSDRLGFTVSPGQISTKLVEETAMIEVSVKDGNPERAALIANTLIDVFIEYNDAIQNNRFAESEQSLQTQITEIEAQIARLQTEMSQISEESLQTQQQEVEAQISELEVQIQQLKDEIEVILPKLTPAAQGAPGAANDLSQTTNPIPTATLSPTKAALIKEQKDLLDEKQGELSQLESLLNLYQQVRINLLVFGDSNPSDGQGARQEQLQGTLALYQQIYTSLLSSYEGVRLARLRSTPNVVQIEQAHVPGTPIQPQPLRSAMIGGIIGLLFVGGLAFLIEYLDDTLKTPEDVTRYLNIPVIGLIGEMKGAGKNGKGEASMQHVFVADNPRSPVAEAFRSLRTNLDFASVNKPIHSLLVTSAGPGEGKTTVAINLAVAMAQGDKKVILLDCDLRRPTVHRILQIANRIGLSDLIRSQNDSAEAINRLDGAGLSVITTGALPPNPAELLGSDKMTAILHEFEAAADIVIIDSPPVIVADPVVLAAKVSGVLIVIEPGKTKIDTSQAMLEQLHRAGARVIGAVLNPISRKRSHYYYGKYRYYSQYYNSRSYGEYVSGNGSHPRKTGWRLKRPKLIADSLPKDKAS